jgi:hypothetical protein
LFAARSACLFFDDGSLARLLGGDAAMLLLVAGTVAALIENVVRMALTSRTKD